MADDGDKRTYPRLPAKNWWTLRDQFKKTMPTKVDADYLQSVLSLSSAGSAGNLIGPLRALGLIDDEGRTTERALDWRQDESYKKACDEMLAEVYPDSLRSAFPDPSLNQGGVTSWFSRNTRAGQDAASKMAALYALVSKGDPEAGQTNGSATAAPRTKVESKGAPSGSRSGENKMSLRGNVGWGGLRVR
ncbi:MAG: DUF5343 domain-containing protein [bacterium]|nr:DUF5343 domain-containing protein [bacterium]